MCWRKYPLKIRFNGARNLRGAPICELSTTLAAVQRMVCRAHMLSEGGRTALTGMPKDERLRYSLRLVSKDWLSKTFYLDWLSKGVPGEAFDDKQAAAYLALLHEALMRYVILKVDIPPENPAGKLALAIYNDVQDISNRLGQAGDIRDIEIQILGNKRCTIDKKVAAYVDSLKGETYDLAVQVLPGEVVAPRTRDRDYALIRSSAHQIKLYADNKVDSAQVLDGLLKVLSRYPAPGQYQPRFFFNGKPRFKIGGDPDSYSDFVLTPPYSPILYETRSGKKSELEIPGL